MRILLFSHASGTMASLTLLMGFVVAHSAFASPIISERDRDNYCRHYANMAVKDQEANEKFGCGYRQIRMAFKFWCPLWLVYAAERCRRD